MHYVMADIHGEYDRYMAMLDKIAFSDDDTLYIIGDVIDRQPGGVDILLDIMGRQNCVLLKGNHEQLCIDTLGSVNVYGARKLWQSNGGSCTYRELLYHRSPAERARIMDFLEALPLYLEVSVSGRDYYLVHGYPTTDGDGPLWERIAPDSVNPVPCKTVIVGHTPTPYLTGDFSSPYSIWHRDGIICIDCGYGNATEHRRLACLRLEDMQEYYV